MDKKESEFNKVKKKLEGMGFSFTRVSDKTKSEFKQFARKEFADDRGAAFTHVWKFFKGECSSGHEEINAKIDILADQITKITSEIIEIKTQFQQVVEGLNKANEEKPKKTRLSGFLPSEKLKEKEE